MTHVGMLRSVMVAKIVVTSRLPRGGPHTRRRVRVRPAFRHLAYVTRAPTQERALLLGVALLVGATRLMLPRLSLRRVEQFLVCVPVPSRRITAGFTAAGIVAMVDAVAARLGVTCLGRALVIRELLVRRGDATRVRIGVVLASGNTLRAHAWVEDATGAVIGGMANPRNYALLPALPPPSSRPPHLGSGR